MLLGILAGLATGALWGLTFVAPRAVEPFTALDLGVARYGIFGLLSVALMSHPRFRPHGIGGSRAVIGLLLGGVGYVGFFVAAATAVKLAGPAIPPLVIGTMPVLLAVIANLRDRTVAWRALALPLALITAGVALVNAATLAVTPEAGRDTIILGVLAAVAALAVWVGYGLVNAAVMRAADAPDGLRWTGVQGIGALLGSLVLLPFTSLASSGDVPGDLARFLGWSLALGIAASWFATWCWVVAARRLPLALAAQLIVAETVFGLAYGFLFEARWPVAAEWTGGALQIAGVAAALAAFARRAAPADRSPAALTPSLRREGAGDRREDPVVVALRDVEAHEAARRP